MGGKTLFFVNWFTASKSPCLRALLGLGVGNGGRAGHNTQDMFQLVLFVLFTAHPAQPLPSFLLHLPSSPSETSQSAVSEWCRDMGCAELDRAFSWGLGETSAETQLDLACSEGGGHFILCLFGYLWSLEGNVSPAKTSAGFIFSISGSRSPFLCLWSNSLFTFWALLLSSCYVQLQD